MAYKALLGGKKQRLAIPAANMKEGHVLIRQQLQIRLLREAFSTMSAGNRPHPTGFTGSNDSPPTAAPA